MNQDHFFLHPAAICDSERVGAGTRIWPFSHILQGASIGEDCNICEHVFIENDVVVGNRVTVKSGVQLWDGVVIEDDVFIGPNATFTNDRFPRSKSWQDRVSTTRVRQGASIGANATILPGLEIGESAMIGAGSVVTRDVPAYAVVAGNPARLIGYDSQEKRAPEVAASADNNQTLPGGARFIALKTASDVRGTLSACEFEAVLPFTPTRLFNVYGVDSEFGRGDHAHRACAQFLTVPAGALRVMLDDGVFRVDLSIADPSEGLLIPPMVWSSQYAHRPGTVLTVLASLPFDETDYVRSYGDFIRLRGLDSHGP